MRLILRQPHIQIPILKINLHQEGQLLSVLMFTKLKIALKALSFLY
jgi:hypothetical protein